MNITQHKTATSFTVFHYLATTSAVLQFVLGIGAGVLCYGAAWSPYVIGVLGFVLVILSVYGSWSLRKFKFDHVYAYDFMLFVLLLATGVLGGIVLCISDQVRAAMVLTSRLG